jgi:threonine aldolase
MMYGEAVVFCDPALGVDARFIRKQATQLPSKMRYVATQFEALLTDDLWLRNAAHANAMARRIREGLARVPGVRFPSPTDINLVLVALPQPVWDGLVADGYSFSRRGPMKDGIIRIACAFDTPVEAVDALLESAYRHAGLAGGAPVNGRAAAPSAPPPSRPSPASRRG